MFFGYPGSGKSTFAAQLAKNIKYAHLSGEKLVASAIGQDRGLSDKELLKMILYMAQEFINCGVGVILDIDLPRKQHRAFVKEFAKKNKIKSLLIWLQIDAETAKQRLGKHARRDFERTVNSLQNPTGEEYIVISGKHTFKSQNPPVINKLYQMGVLKVEDLTSRVAKPELMSLVPKPTLSGEKQDQKNISIN